MFYTYTQIARIWVKLFWMLRCPHNLISMKMTVHVHTEPFCHTVRVQRDMAQNELIHKHTNTMNLLKANSTIVFVIEDIMVATNKDLTTIHPLNKLKILLVDDNVTEEVYSIASLNLGIVTFNHCFIHLFGRSEWTQRTAIGQFKLFP